MAPVVDVLDVSVGLGLGQVDDGARALAELKRKTWAGQAERNAQIMGYVLLVW